MPNDSHLFNFETAFAGTLRCIPMCIRYRLDQIGIKLTLRQWSNFAPEERYELVALVGDEPKRQALFDECLMQLMSAHGGGHVERVPSVAGTQWNSGKAVPPRVVDYARGLKVAAPSTERWAKLSPLQQFALFKLTRPNHDNDNFIPAMREFGLME